MNVRFVDVVATDDRFMTFTRREIVNYHRHHNPCSIDARCPMTNIQAAAGDPVWKAGITEKMRELRDPLLGVNPSLLEELLVRRILNGWVAVYALELEQTLRPPAERRDREHLDKALSRAERRYTQAISELARVRKLQTPTILAKLCC